MALQSDQGYVPHQVLNGARHLHPNTQQFSTREAFSWSIDARASFVGPAHISTTCRCTSRGYGLACGSGLCQATLSWAAQLTNAYFWGEGGVISQIV